MATLIARRDPCTASAEDYQVNAIRLAYADFLNGTPKNTVNVLRQLEGSFGIADAGGDHGNGFDLIACLTVMSHESSEARYRELLLKQVALVHSRFVAYRDQELQNRTVIREAARVIQDIETFNSIRESPRWRDFCAEVDNRLEALSNKESQ